MDTTWLTEQTAKRSDIFDDFEFNTKVQIGRGSYGHVYKVKPKNASEGIKFYALKEVEMGYHSTSTCREIAVCATEHCTINPNTLKRFLKFFHF